ncbi:MAG: hypothetical protein A3E82_07130 [Gammaproteobacteria bacterium RIFCSPHIGHO2_12_FULL_38_11]|nr:MAG: hypothetical protein A3E82_07130 [Gammaproteobacteria bacterium RIFCSPHIGHO2_12_FULL_38_11]
MGIGSYLKNTVKDNANVKGWSSWGAVKDNAKTIGGILKDVKTEAEKPIVKTTFAEAIKKYGLSESDLNARMKSYFRVAVFCAVLGLVAFCWTLFLLFKLMFLSSLMALGLSTLMLAYAFREHFYYFQIKQKKLDCTVHEWVSSFFPNKTGNKK